MKISAQVFMFQHHAESHHVHSVLIEIQMEISAQVSMFQHHAELGAE
jgi:hypothetical protein